MRSSAWRYVAAAVRGAGWGRQGWFAPYAAVLAAQALKAEVIASVGEELFNTILHML